MSQPEKTMEELLGDVEVKIKRSFRNHYNEHIKDKEFFLVAVNKFYGIEATQNELQMFLGRCFDDAGRFSEPDGDFDNPVLTAFKENKALDRLNEWRFLDSSHRKKFILNIYVNAIGSYLLYDDKSRRVRENVISIIDYQGLSTRDSDWGESVKTAATLINTWCTEELYNILQEDKNHKKNKEEEQLRGMKKQRNSNEFFTPNQKFKIGLGVNLTAAVLGAGLAAGFTAGGGHMLLAATALTIAGTAISTGFLLAVAVAAIAVVGTCLMARGLYEKHQENNVSFCA